MRYRQSASCSRRIRQVSCALFLVNSMIQITVVAQQAYNNVSGYDCRGVTQNAAACDAFALYRSPNNQMTIQSVARLFNVDAKDVANLSDLNLTTDNKLKSGNAVYIPLRCKCVNGIYRALVTYVIQTGDTFERVANTTLQGLTTLEAIGAANSVIPSKHAIGQKINVPLRCACPSSQQSKDGTRFLLTVSLFPSESALAVSNYFRVLEDDLITANRLSGLTDVLQIFTTLLVPLSKLTPLSSFLFIIPRDEPSIAPSSIAPPSTAPSMSSSNNPETSPSQTAVHISIYKDRTNTPLYVGLAAGVFGLILAAVVSAILAMKKVRGHRGKEKEGRELIEIRQFSKTQQRVRQHAIFNRGDGMSTVVDGDELVTFTYEELCSATNDFNPDSRLQGSVFLGNLNETLVAIKQVNGNMTQQIKILSQIHHMNVVRLIGACVNESGHRFLVFEYAENGSLSDCLHSQVAHPTSIYSRSAILLSWSTRVQIALDIASGLEYIHNYINPNLVHKDVKSSNILLDADWRAKMANFGMAKSAKAFMPELTLTSHIVGTQGYMAPEYLEHGLVTTKADVFSFGVVLLELITGKEAIVQADGDRKGGQLQGCTLANIMTTILKHKDDMTMTELQDWIDPRLNDAYPVEIAFNLAYLANSCVDADLTLRPSMKDMAFALSNILAASLEWEMSTLRKIKCLVSPLSFGD